MSPHVTLSINERALSSLPPAPHGIRYHQQDDHGIIEMYCGAASGQIVLKSVGTLLLPQEDLFTSSKGVSAPDPLPRWHTAPDGLTNILNLRKPATFTDTFNLWALDSEEAISRKICWAIQRGVAPIALVEDGSHWIVIAGFTASAAPTSSTDTGYTIESFDVYDPYPATPSPPPPVPPPHADGTDDCGTGSSTGKDRGDETNTINYEGRRKWRAHYMTKVKKGNLTGKYVAICDSDSPADTPDTPPQLGGTVVTDLDEIRRRATEGLAEPAQAERVPLRMALDGTHVSDPLLVEREDFDPPEFYYIVPFVRDDDDGVVPVLVDVDAYESGSWSGFIASPDGTHFGHALTADEVIQQVAVMVDGVEVPLKSEELHGNADGFHANLVWRPCAESLSPYWPFYRFDAHLPDGSPITIYVRIDGVAFTELTEGMGM